MAVYKQKDSRNWWYKFTWHGELIRETTKQTNKRVAEQIEAARKTQFAKGEVGIRDHNPVPTLTQFIQTKFLPYVRASKADKPRTVVFYATCAANLQSEKRLAETRLDGIRNEHITAFIEQRRSAGMKVSTINRDLATLRRILHLALEWGAIFTLPLVRLLPGEASRDRVLREDEEQRYLMHSTGALLAMALITLDCGLRPEEIHRLRWEANISNGTISIHRGKRDGSRRRVDMTDRVETVLSSIRPANPYGWVFPAPTQSGHIETSSYKKQHRAALKASRVADFVPYSLRHTCLTRWARAGMDAFTLKYLAGHKSLATTLRYIHLNRADTQDRLRETRSRMEIEGEDRGGHSFGHSGIDAPLSDPIERCATY